MREILADAARWVGEGRAFAIATVVGVEGSAPREVGASLIVDAHGELVGTVSGGCVEGVVYESCLEVIAGAEPRVERFAYTDPDGFAVGLTCGGTIEVLVRAALPGSAAAADLRLLAARERASSPTRYTLITAGPAIGEGTIDDGPLPEHTEPTQDPTASLRERTRAEGTAPHPDSARITLSFGIPPRLILVGAVEFTVALARIGAAAGMRVTVVDPREVFATAARFPEAQVVNEWPDRFIARTEIDAQTAVCVLSHDPKLDAPAIRAALASPAGYVGAMGSRRTVAERRERLVDAGVPESALARLRSPIGLDLGGRSPEATALSILAEIIADRHGGTGARLSHRTGPVHADSINDAGFGTVDASPSAFPANVSASSRAASPAEPSPVGPGAAGASPTASSRAAAPPAAAASATVPSAARPASPSCEWSSDRATPARGAPA